MKEPTMKKVFRQMLCIVLLLLGFAFCLTACNIKNNNEDTTTLASEEKLTTLDSTPEETTPEVTTPEETTPE